MSLDRRLKPAFWVFAVLLLLALFRDVLANGRPLYCRIEGQTLYPGLRSMWVRPEVSYGNALADSLELTNNWLRYRGYEAAWFAPIPFTPGKEEAPAQGTIRAQPPGSPANDGGRGYRHWLGTDYEGRDVTAGIIAGARIALLTALVVLGITFLLGTFLGAIAGFWGDDRLHTRLGTLCLVLLGLPVAWFYALIAGPYAAPGLLQWLKNGLLFFAILTVFQVAGRLLSRLPGFSRQVILPADLLIMRLGEIFDALPKFIFLLIVARLFDGNQPVWLMLALIGALSWPAVATLVRAELLRVRALDFVTAARGLGLPEIKVLWRHALPNAMRAALIAATVGVAAAIQLEAALSFLGLSGTPKSASWGMLLHAGQEASQAWWLVLPPGLAICTVVLALNRLGEMLSETKQVRASA